MLQGNIKFYFLFYSLCSLIGSDFIHNIFLKLFNFLNCLLFFIQNSVNKYDAAYM
jgi:hypothetical protein